MKQIIMPSYINITNKNFLKITKSFIERLEKQYYYKNSTNNNINNLTYIDILNLLNIKIPHLCYHNQLPLSGNCRLCLGVIGNDKKPSPLCVSNIRLDTIINFNSLKIIKLREDILEFILLNHPMDCPSCDQGGECDLQDYNFKFGNDRSRSFFYLKKTILNKKRGPLIKGIMNRCINCTRCIRFFDEILGNYYLGVMGRGKNSEIDTFINKNFDNTELSGNVIDICPVGSLISKYNIFKKRSWNLKLINSLDIFDSICSSVVFLVDGYKIIKVLPNLNKYLNENYITDRIRFFIDGLYKQRIKNPLFKKDFEFIKIKWSEINYILKKKINKIFNLGFYFGELLNNESIFFFNKFMNIIGNSNKFSIDDTLYLNNDLNNNYLFNFKLNNLNMDMNIFFGLNIKKELSIFNLKLRKKFLKTNILFLNIGTKINLTMPCYNLCFKFTNIIKLIEGKNKNCNIILKKKKPFFFFNINLFKNENIYNFFLFFKYKLNYILNNKNTIFNYISSNIDLLNKYYINIKSKYKDKLFKLNYLYLTNVDNNFKNFIYNKKINLNNIFIIYQGHHINKYLNYANIILPSKLYLEEKGSFINIEGKIIKIKEIIYNTFKNIKDNLLIIYYIFSIFFFKYKKKFDFIIRNEYNYLYKYNYNLKTNIILKNNITYFNNISIKLKSSIIKDYIINSDIYNFYLNNNINMASKKMNLCSKLLITHNNYFKN